MKTKPNRGILLSIRSAVIVGVVSGMSVAVILALIPLFGNSLFDSPIGLFRPLLAIMIVALMTALSSGFWFGTVDVVFHYVLRLTLFLCGYTPFRYIRFVDYAARELNFLQKVGGGYIFIHRMLLEHFVAMHEGIPDALDIPTFAAVPPAPSDPLAMSSSDVP